MRVSSTPALEAKCPDSIDTYLPEPGMVGRTTTIRLNDMTADGSALLDGTSELLRDVFYAAA